MFFFSEHCPMGITNKISRTKHNEKGIKRIKWIFYYFNGIRWEELNEENYKEQLIDSIYPNWDKNIRSTHTIGSVENLTVIDAEIKRRK